MKKEESIQGSSGALKDQSGLAGRFATQAEEINEFSIESLQRFEMIPDFSEETTALYPIVLIRGNSLYCLDGWNLVAKAKAQNKTGITCHGISVEETCTDMELAIRKVATRTMPQGGRARYPELVRNVNKLKEILLSSTDNLTMYRHGGARQGEDFEDNRENDVVTLLASRLGKSRNAVKAYLNHGESLSEVALEALIEETAEKEFFEKAQSNKRQMINFFKSTGKTDEEIKVHVSNYMLDMMREFADKRTITSFFATALPTDDQTVATTITNVIEQAPVCLIEESRYIPLNQEIPECLDLASEKNKIRAYLQTMIEVGPQDDWTMEQTDYFIMKAIYEFGNFRKHLQHLKQIQAGIE